LPAKEVDMTTAGVALSSRLTVDEGLALVARWRASGQRQSVWCAAQGVQQKRLSSWVRRSERRAVAAVGDGFVVGVVSSGVRVRVRVGCGATIEVDAGFQAALLRQVVAALC
jgi:hypothetical protein